MLCPSNQKKISLLYLFLILPFSNLNTFYVSGKLYMEKFGSEKTEKRIRTLKVVSSLYTCLNLSVYKEKMEKLYLLRISCFWDFYYFCELKQSFLLEFCYKILKVNSKKWVEELTKETKIKKKKKERKERTKK